MRTRIIIEHETAEALKGHPIWKQIMALMFADGPISVTELADVDNEDEDAEREYREREMEQLAHDGQL